MHERQCSESIKLIKSQSQVSGETHHNMRKSNLNQSLCFFSLFIYFLLPLQARSLDQQNAVLRAKISMFTNPEQGGPASTSILLTSAIGTYKTQIDGMSATKEAIIAEIEHYKSIIDDIQTRLVV